MHNPESLLFNLTACLAAALFFGWLAGKLRLSPIVAYLVAGVICGPFTGGFVVNPHMAEELADLGVVLLMFGVGLKFNFPELIGVRGLALPGAIFQSGVTTFLVAVVSHMMGMGWTQGALVGLAFSVASTVVLGRMLTDHNHLSAPGGHIAMGWTVVEDIFTVVVLLLLPMLAGTQGDNHGTAAVTKELGWALGKVALLMVLIGVVGMRLMPRMLGGLAGSREMFNLAVPVVALGIACASAEFFGVSLALGSFLAGLVAGQARPTDRVEATLAPLRDPFAALFFVAIGTLLDPRYVIGHPVELLFALAVILLVKPFLVLLLMRVLRQPLHTALVVALGLGQIGEFSFILIRQASTLNLLPAGSAHRFVAAAIISIALNPFLFAWLPQIERFLSKLPWLKGTTGAVEALKPGLAALRPEMNAARHH